MLYRLAALTLLGALAACDAPPLEKVYMLPAAERKAPVLSAQQVYAQSERCAKATGDQFRRDWKDGVVAGPDGKMTADFTSHYNARMNTCFYLLTVRHSPDKSGQGGASADSLRKFLFDIDDNEQYGEYLGPATSGSPKAGLAATCRIEAMYCASEGEWKVLSVPYMQE